MGEDRKKKEEETLITETDGQATAKVHAPEPSFTGRGCSRNPQDLGQAGMGLDTRGCEVGFQIPSNTHSLAESGPPNSGTDLNYGTVDNNQRKNDN